MEKLYIKDNKYKYKFECESPEEKWRVHSMFTKEPGTIQWIDSFEPDSIFYDIGSNMGIYSIYAHKICKTVYAFEPHVGSHMSLLRSIKENKANNIKPLSVALHNTSGFFNFEYYSNSPASSNSQLDNKFNFTPVATELKFATTIDKLIEDKVIAHPTYVKIDVDGNEILILEGMKATLAGGTIKLLQVELGKNKDEANKLLEPLGYGILKEHYTETGLILLNQGKDPNTIVHNVIYSKTSFDK